jgi:putative addiction module component (TIGR02574 family)
MRNSKFRDFEPGENTESDVEAAWAAEIERRIAEVESGAAETISWEGIRIRESLSKS